jgi:hypothetical protein
VTLLFRIVSKTFPRIAHALTSKFHWLCSLTSSTQHPSFNKFSVRQYSLSLSIAQDHHYPAVAASANKHFLSTIVWICCFAQSVNYTIHQFRFERGRGCKSFRFALTNIGVDEFGSNRQKTFWPNLWIGKKKWFNKRKKKIDGKGKEKFSLTKPKKKTPKKIWKTGKSRKSYLWLCSCKLCVWLGEARRMERKEKLFDEKRKINK